MTRAISALLLVAALAGGFWLYIQRGFSTRTPPGALEAWAANHMREWSVPARYQVMRNPVECSSLPLRQAMAHWADHCATCHANNGDGATMLGKTMYPRPPDMRQAKTQDQTDGEIYYTIKNGVRLTGMPAFGEPGDNDSDSWKLVCFVRHLPELTSAEAAEMKMLNAKTPEELEEESQEADFLGKHH